ncbi:MerR family DNA-binding transcriptional regulator [Telmatospirillum sp. J64-1]|uniref:MerR family transcriptional regulator n=1 Tax=Telmatospirillum sp. J64-1 TaxID=2502183 RepID=UPI00115E40C3|nr:MerR family DNA-binding transcriptional regulator [Telmatospirillum sp. J64-1]
MGKTYSIADLAREFGITTRTIRFYEDQGLLSPRREGQKRLYSARDRVRLKLIMRGKRLGFSLGECREVLDLYDAEQGGETEQLRLVVAKIQARRQALRQQLEDIAVILAELDSLERQCTDLLAQKDGK